MQESYAVSWRGFDGRTHAGRLDIGPRSLHLEGGDRAAPVSYELAYAQLEEVHVTRRLDERLRGLPTLVVRWRSGATLRVACIAQPGVLPELAEQLTRQLS